MGSVFGGGAKAAKKEARQASDQARRDNERARQIQQVANDQQLAQLVNAENDTGSSRRAARGRRLFLADQSSGGLATTLGG